MRRVVSLALLLAVVACGTISDPHVAAPGAPSGPSASPHVTLPQPVAQPITRTSAAAQVAWIGTYPANGNGAGAYVAIDPLGKIVGRLSTDDGPYWRSADGARIVAIHDDIRSYSALDGRLERNYGPIAAGHPIDAAFSPDGRWLAIVGSGAFIQVIDLQTGLVQTTPLGHSANAQHPGLTTSDPVGLVWSRVVFSPDSTRVYTIVDWAGPVRLTSFDVTSKGLVQRATAVDGDSGKKLISCGGPGLAARVVGKGSTLVTFCYSDAGISFIDLASLNTVTSFRASMANPFWLAPIFTPDGQLLYLHQYASFGDTMQVVDLASHALVGPVRTPLLSDPGPFAWLFPVVYAGGTPSTVPMSPDGLKLYSVANTGITTLGVPDLKPLARLAPDIAFSEVWVSGDGKTLFGSTNGKAVLVIPEAGGPPIKVDLPDQAGYFLSPEHG